MRILQINNFENINGGSDRVYQQTCRMLLDRGFNVASVSCGNESFDFRKTSAILPRNDYISLNPFRTLTNIRNFIYRPDTVKIIEDIVREFKPDIAHLHIFYGQLSSSVISALNKLQIPCVMTIHEYRMLCPISTLYTQTQGVCEKCASGEKWQAIVQKCNRDSLIASTLSFIESWTRDEFFNYLDSVDHFFMVSEFCRKKHAEYFPEIMHKSSVLYNFIANQEIASVPGCISFDAPFLYAGRLSHEKGINLLCSAFRCRPKLRLRIAGDGPLAEQIQLNYADCKNIEFLGKLSKEQLLEEMGNAKFSIVPSEWYENNPMSVLESFSVGTPVIGANIGGIPELVLNGLTGILFAPSDRASLLQALDEANAMPIDARDLLGMKALSLIKHNHSEMKYHNLLISSYKDVINKSKYLFKK